MLKIKQITEEKEQEIAYDIRRKVFVEEQMVSPEEEYDAYEATSRHFLALYDEKPCGTARWRYTDKGIKLERFAVLADYRNQGVGLALVQAVVVDIRAQADSEGKKMYLHAQLRAIPLYEKAGFRKEGEQFEEAGIQHYRMFFG